MSIPLDTKFLEEQTGWPWKYDARKGEWNSPSFPAIYGYGIGDFFRAYDIPNKVVERNGHVNFTIDTHAANPDLKVPSGMEKFHAAVTSAKAHGIPVAPKGGEPQPNAAFVGGTLKAHIESAGVMLGEQPKHISVSVP